MPDVKWILCMFAATTVTIFSCAGNNEKKEDKITAMRNEEQGTMVERGRYLVTAGACYDCHTPKQMTAQGPVDDSSRALSGRPQGAPLPPIDTAALNPGGWVLLSPDLTAFVGPWGISYPANLTPDSATGIGNWTEDVFIQTMRTGKHLGQANGRPILPPMPWYNLAKLKDDDLKSIFAFLQSLPPVSNKVPPPTTPEEARKMAAR